MKKQIITWIGLSLFLSIAKAPAASGPELTKQKSAYQLRVENVSKTFAQALNKRDLDSIKQIFDAKALAENLHRTVFADASKSDRQSFVKSFSETIYSQSFNSWFTLLEKNNGIAEYRKVIRDKGEARGLVRLNLKQGGMNFIELFLDRETGKIVDFLPYTTGQKASDSMASLLAMTNPNGGNAFQRVLGLKKVDNKTLEIFTQIGKLNQAGKYAESYALLVQLPKKVQELQMVSVMIAGHAGHVSDEAYADKLEALARVHGKKPELSLMLFDYYFMKGQYQNAINAINRVEDRVGDDALLKSLKSIVWLNGDKLDNALREINGAIKLEQDYEDYYWFKADVLNKQNKFSQLTDLFEFMSKKFNFIMDPEVYKTEPTYKAFSESNAYKEWRKKLK